VSSTSSVIERANPRSLPQPFTALCGGLVLLGVGAFVFGLATDPQTAWLAFHTNFIYYANLSQGGLVLACIFVVVGARWPGPYRRIAEGLAAWVPVSLVLGCIGYFGGDYIFEWMREGAVGSKGVWLNEARVYLSDLGVLALLAILSLVYLRASVRPTLGGSAAHVHARVKGLVESFSRGWRGDREEREFSEARLRTLAPIIILLFALGYSLIAFDQVMSMEQTWYSNLFAAYVSWGGLLSALAATALIALLLRNSPGFRGHITESRMHDIGKLVFGFSTFWMYLFWSQYLVIYYGNLPEETAFFRDRLGPQFVVDKGYTTAAWALQWANWDFKWSRLGEAYGWLSMAVWTCTWIIPFWVLLGQRPKKIPWIAGPVVAVLLVGVWLERNLLIWPSVVKHDSTAWMGLLPLCIAAGFFGAFALVYLTYARIFPTLAVPDES